MLVLVGGATGYLGGHLARELRRRGHEVRAMARDRSKVSVLDGLADDVVVADASERASLAGSCDGVDAVVSAIGLMRPSLRTSFHDVDYGANRNLLEEARAAGVEKFVYVSVLQRPGMEKLKIVRAKRAFEDELAGSGLAYAILRPNGYFSDLDEFLAMARKGRAYVFGGGRFEINPIDGADVATVTVDAIERDEIVIELGGPDVLSHRRIAEAAFAALGKPVKISSVPAWLARALVGVLRHATPAGIHGSTEFVLSVLSRDMVAPQVGSIGLVEHFRGQGKAGCEVTPARPGARRAVGMLFLIAGAAKFSNRIENVPGVLAAAATANEGTRLARPSAWLARHPTLVATGVGVTMIGTGAGQLLGRAKRASAVAQLLLLAAFSATLHRAYPAVLPVDAAFAAAIVYTSATRRLP